MRNEYAELICRAFKRDIERVEFEILAQCWEAKRRETNARRGYQV